MKRNLLSAAIFMSFGIYLWNNFYIGSILCVVAVLGAYIFWCVRKTEVMAALLAVIMVFAGFFAINISNYNAIKRAEPFTKDILKISGRVLGVSKTDYGQSIILKHEYKDENGHSQNIKIKAYTNKDFIKFQYGDVINFTAKLKMPDGGAGFGGYNGRMSFRSENILLESDGNIKEIYVFENKINKFNIFDISYLVKEAVCERISNLYEGTAAGLMQGILVGEKENIPKDIEESFRISGISHIIVVSGMHVNIFVAVLIFILSIFGIGKRRVASLIYIAGAWFFVFVSGCGLSAVRAAWVTTILFLGRLIKRESDPLNSLGGAVFIMLLINPEVYYNIGFKLSVFSAGTILVFAKTISERFKIEDTLGDSAVVTIAAQLGILPILSQSFGYIGTFGILTNILVCPVVTLLFTLGVISLFIGGVPVLGSGIVGFCSLILDGMALLSQSVSKLPMSAINFGSINGLSLLIYILFLVALWFLLKKETKIAKRALAVSLGLILMISLYGTFSHKASITFLDSGDSDCTIVESGSKVLMFDGGGSYSFSVSDKVIIPYFSNRKIKSVDAAFVTHYHVDHMFGIKELIEKGYIKSVILPSGIAKESFEISEAAKKAGIPLHYVGNFDKLYFGDIEVTSFNTYDGKEENNGFIYSVSLNGKKILISGDTDKEGEKILLSSGKDFKSDILKVPHHGSATSGSDEFLKAVSPQIAVVCSGEDIISKDRKDEYKKLGTRLYFTHQWGHIRINLSKSGRIKILPGRNNFYELRNFKKSG